MATKTLFSGEWRLNADGVADRLEVAFDRACQRGTLRPLRFLGARMERESTSSTFYSAAVEFEEAAPTEPFADWWTRQNVRFVWGDAIYWADVQIAGHWAPSVNADHS